MKFTKSLKFRITLWYSLLLSFFCIAIIIVSRMWLGSYIKDIMLDRNPERRFMRNVHNLSISELTKEQRELVRDARINDLENIQNSITFSVLPLVAFSFIGGYLLADNMLKPLDNLVTELKNKEVNNLSDKIIFDDTDDELSQLMNSYNSMLDRLDRSFESQKQFVENASHELKTPLSVMQLTLDTILMDVGMSKKEIFRLLNLCKYQTRFMNTLIEDLLLLTSLQQSVQFTKVNINDVVKQVKKDLNSMAKEKGINIVIIANVQGEYIINGNEVLLQRAISNIIENSIKYSEGSRIEIILTEQYNKLTISCRDDGKGISSSESSRVFDRFYRIDKGRSRKEGGFGLGLSITKQIVNKHLGKIYINEKYRNGAEFIIELPL